MAQKLRVLSQAVAMAVLSHAAAAQDGSVQELLNLQTTDSDTPLVIVADSVS